MPPKRDEGFITENCTLHPIVRPLVEEAFLKGERAGKQCEKYRCCWLPDRKQEAKMYKVPHDCRCTPLQALGVSIKPIISAGQMIMTGYQFQISSEPEAIIAVYIAPCHSCKAVFFMSCYDPNDTIERFGMEVSFRRRGGVA